MLASRLLVAVDEDGVGGVEEQNLILALLAAQLLERLRQGAEHVLPAADVRHDSHAPELLARLLAQTVEGAQQLRRKIVDAIKADVLQNVNRLRFSGSGEPCYN